MARLVHAEWAAARQPQGDEAAPALVADPALHDHAAGNERGVRGLDVVAEQYSSCRGGPSVGWTATSAGGRARMSQPPPASTVVVPSRSRRNARSASASVL
jgi:hypothetical protein